MATLERTLDTAATAGRSVGGAVVAVGGELLSVQRLRGIAVLMVFFVHLEDMAKHFPGWESVNSLYALRLGYSAPDLFFVISGFIMAYITFSRPFNARIWAISRVFRIYPMYILFSALVVGLWLYNPAMTMGSGKQSWTSVLLSFAGFPQAGLPLLFVGWTIEHEIVFYVIIFLTALYLGHEKLPWVMCAFSVTALLNWLMRESLHIDVWDFHLSSPYMIEFTLGVLLHRWWGRLLSLGCVKPAFVAVAAATLGIFLSESGDVAHVPMTRVFTFGIAYASLLLAALNYEQRQTDAGEWTTTRDWLVMFGDASYSIYLSHSFVLASFGKLFPLVGNDAVVQRLLILVAALVALAFGFTTHAVIERRVIDLGKKVCKSNFLRVC